MPGKKKQEEPEEEYFFDQEYDEGYAPEVPDEYEPEDAEPDDPPKGARKGPRKKEKSGGLFRPSLRKPNFVLSVAVGVVRVVLLLVAILVLAGVFHGGLVPATRVSVPGIVLMLLGLAVVLAASICIAPLPSSYTLIVTV